MRKTNDITRTLRRPFACFALCALALAGAMSETGCRKIVTPAQKGDNVLFSAGVGGSESGTKTAYTNSNASNRSLAENINWLSGDQIRIWCAECSEPTMDTYGNADHFADYTVTPKDGTPNKATIAVNPGTVGLRWGDAGTTHHFYAIYPSPNTTDKSSDTGAFGESDSPKPFTFTGHIPATQKIKGNLTTSTDGTTTIAAPDMSNLYMVSKTAATPESNPEVFLKFTPLTTAIQFTIQNDMTEGNLQVERVKIISDPKTGDKKNLAGAFSADISGWTPATSGSYTYPTCTQGTTGLSTELSIDFTGTSACTTGIAKGDRLQFTFFLLPTQSINDLSFVITRKEGESGQKTIKTRLELANGGKVTFPAHKKTYVTGILVPDGQTVTFSNITIGDWGAGQSEAVEIEEKTGPDPEYWVDLGMVSEDGYPLYISRRNVQSISNGVAVFADSETAFGGTFTKEQAMSIVESEDGLDCICLSTSQALSMLLGNNFNFALSEGVAEFTSKINGAVVKFPYQSGVLYFTMGKIDDVSDDMHALQFDLNCPSSSYLKYYEIDFQIYVYDSAYCKLIYKDTNASKKPYIDFELWHFNTLKSAFWGYPYFPLENNDFETLHKISDSLGPIGLGVVDCGVQYLIEFNNGYRTFCFTNSTFPDGVEIELSDVGGGLQYYELDGKNIKCKDHSGHNPSVQYTATWLGKTISFQFNGRTCLVKGTLVTLADGSRKPVEELTYDDELKVWNFDKGCFDTAKIFWLTKSGMTADHYIKCTFSDGSVLCLTGDKSHHKVYNYTDRFFEGIAKVEVGKEIFTENGVVTLVSKEWIDEPVENYNLMTEGHFNCFANGILTSVRLNNIYPIDENMKFVKDSRKKRPYKDFKAAGISREWYNGLRLSEQTDSLDYIKSKVDIFTEQMAEKPAPSLWQRLKTWWKSIFG